MTKQEHLISLVKPSPYKEKYFKIGRLLFSYQRGSDLWVNSEGKFFREYLLSVQKVTKENETILTLVFYKIKFNFGILPRESK